MKRLSISILVTAFCGITLTATPMSKRDRERLVAHLEMTQSWLVDEVSPLSAAQLNYRMAPGKWTIAEVVQHLAVAEPMYWDLFQKAMKQAPGKLDPHATDADVLWYGIDRTRREKTEASKDPAGQTIDVRQALDSFRKLHATMLDYARDTDDDLRSHVVPDWGVDAYQCLLEISTHEQRHILQIREIKADAGFPKH